MANWSQIAGDSSLWHPGNRGLNPRTAKFLCTIPACRLKVPFDWTCDGCGAPDQWALAKGMALPGVFCQGCGSGNIAWDCPKCKQGQRLVQVFWYDAAALAFTAKKSFLKGLFGA
jgi:hypothetical protein